MRSIRNIESHMEGRPVTGQRKLLLSLIQKAGGHISAKELYRRASRKNESISLATVYRTLRLFKDLGLIEERRLGQVNCYYEIKDLAGHQHLVCSCCGNVIEFDSNLIRKIIRKVQLDYGFNVTKTELYMEGYCEQCKDSVSNRAGTGEVLGVSIKQVHTQKAKSHKGQKGPVKT
ncbi:MAG: transcriptional repressor [Deltaproteobacteria bacterium]|nr:transcriptional repressor [Deltaproteobacteria bacterium]MBW2338883.1 transcriptional repressor [Deltaproteobacteria bacterium]